MQPKTEEESRKTILFKISSKKKYLGKNLIKDVKDINNENY
jgi:hypothetical protein